MRQRAMKCFASLTIAMIAGGSAYASVTDNGTRVCDSSRVALEAIDANHRLGDVNVQLIYATAVAQNGGDWFTTAQDHTLQYREYPDGTFADVPTTNPTGPFIPASGTNLSDDVTVSDGNRRANTDPSDYMAGAKQFQDSNLHNYGATVKNKHTEAQWAVEFTNCPDAKKYEFQVRWGTRQGDRFVTYLAQVWTPFLSLADHAAGQQTDAFTESGGETDAELYSFQLDPGASASINVTEVIIRIDSVNGLADGDWAGIELIADTDGNGDVNGAEASVSSGTVNTGAGTITFSTAFNVTTAMNYIMRADFATLDDTDDVTLSLVEGDITAAKPTLGSCSIAAHQEFTPVATAQSFHYIDPVNVTPGVSATWTTVNLSPYVPAGATGAILRVNNQTESITEQYGLQMLGSTDNRIDLCYVGAQTWAMTGVNGSRQIEAYLGNIVTMELWVTGYTTGGVTFFTNAIDKSLGSIGVWTPISIAADTSTDTAIGAIVEVMGQWQDNWGLQKLGSTDDRSMHGRHNWAMVGVDGTESMDGYIDHLNIDFFLVGYITTGATFFTNGIDKSLTTTSTWEPINLSADSGPAVTANGAFIEVYQPANPDVDHGFRKNGTSQDMLGRAGSTGTGHLWGIIEVDENEILEAQINSLTDDFFLTGFSHGGGGSWLATGSYTGTGASTAITGVGFQPDMVIVKRYPNVKGEARTSTMPAGKSKQIQSGSGLDFDRIESLDTDGFTVGTYTEVNASGDPYYWVAIREVSGLSKFGSYTGDGVNDRSITGVGFQPDYVMVFPDGPYNSVHRMSSMTGDESMRFDASGFSSNRIQALESDGFQVGTNSSVNTDGKVYHYAAFKSATGTMAVGTYAGDDTDNRDITAGFQPDWVIVDSDSSVEIVDGSPGSIQRFAAMSGDISVNFSWAYTGTVFDNCIQGFNVSGFEIGSDSVVNSGTAVFHWAAFADTLPSASGKPRIIRWVEVDPHAP